MEKIKFTKKMKIGIASGLCVAVLGVGSVYAAHTVAKNNAIGEDAAKGFAFWMPEYRNQDVLSSDVEFEFKNGTYAYDVDFVTEKAKYEYLIQSSNGNVLKKEVEVRKVKTTKETENTENTENTISELASSETTESISDETTEAATNVSKEETRNNPAQGTIQEETTEQKNINENTTKKPQEQTSKAQNEGVSEKFSEKATQEATRGYISVDEAKQIALTDAGVAEYCNVQFSKTKLENDDGEFNYEIEFYVGNVEYEYEIDAFSGIIIEKSIENNHRNHHNHHNHHDYDYDDYDDDDYDD